MLDILILIASGALVGFAVGLTGVGGGSLMTPILLLLGYSPPVAIGTDLLYAALTKGSGMFFHHQKGNINWKVMALLAAGSLPCSLALAYFYLGDALKEGSGHHEIMTTFLGVMLMLTALVITFQKRIQRRFNGGAIASQPDAWVPQSDFAHKHTATVTLVLGMVLGICVTLTSVGAGAIGASILFLLYPAWRATQVVGTDIAHAVPLTAVAGLGYLANGLADLVLLGTLMVGSIPGIYLGTHVGSLFPDKWMRAVLAIALVSLGVKFTLL